MRGSYFYGLPIDAMSLFFLISEYRGKTDLKGKGTLDTYWLISKEDSRLRRTIAESFEES